MSAKRKLTTGFGVLLAVAIMVGMAIIPRVVQAGSAVAMKATQKIVVRKTASLKGKTVKEIAKGTTVTRTGTVSGGWSRVRLSSGATGYVPSKYLSSAPQENFIADGATMRVKSAATAYERPSSSSKKLTTIPVGTVMTRTGIGEDDAKGWSRVAWNGKIYYVLTPNLQRVSSSELGTARPESVRTQTKTPVATATKQVSTPTPTADAGQTPSPAGVEAMIEQIVLMVNSERAEVGRGPLKLDSGLTKAAALRAKEIVSRYDHVRPNGDSCFSAISNLNDFVACAENIFAGPKTPKEAMAGWMDSEAHRSNVVDGDFTYIGIGLHEYNGCLYWVQLFGGKDEATVTSAPTVTPAATATAASGTSPAPDAQLAEEVIKLLNEERATANLAPLALDAGLLSAADVRAKELVEKFDHIRPDGNNCFSTITNLSSFSSCGENIAKGQSTAKDVMKSWMDSQGHRENILSAQYTHIGVGVYATGGNLHWVQLFGQRK